MKEIKVLKQECHIYNQYRLNILKCQQAPNEWNYSCLAFSQKIKCCDWDLFKRVKKTKKSLCWIQFLGQSSGTGDALLQIRAHVAQIVEEPAQTHRGLGASDLTLKMSKPWIQMSCQHWDNSPSENNYSVTSLKHVFYCNVEVCQNCLCFTSVCVSHSNDFLLNTREIMVVMS